METVKGFGLNKATVGKALARNNRFSIVLIASVLLFSCLLTACATSDKSLHQSGKSESYIAGFHDGRHSGMEEAGNYLEHTVKDINRFEKDREYRSGWLAGEAEGIRIQQEANAIAGAAGTANIMNEAQKYEPDAKAISRKAMKDLDTSTLKNLE